MHGRDELVVHRVQRLGTVQRDERDAVLRTAGLDDGHGASLISLGVASAPPVVVKLPHSRAWKPNGSASSGVDFAYLEAGEGPLVLCLHGFPDHAPTWEPLLSALADAGFRGVAPWMRGYSPTGTADAVPHAGTRARRDRADRSAVRRRRRVRRRIGLGRRRRACGRPAPSGSLEEVRDDGRAAGARDGHARSSSRPRSGNGPGTSGSSARRSPTSRSRWPTTASSISCGATGRRTSHPTRRSSAH